MKTLPTLLLLSMPLFASPALAFDNPPTEKAAQLCYGYAMVGFDSVINSRLGVPVEHAVGLAEKSPYTSVNGERQYSTPVLKIILNAYMWPHSPHDYAVGVFYRCAKLQGTAQASHADW